MSYNDNNQNINDPNSHGMDSGTLPPPPPPPLPPPPPPITPPPNYSESSGSAHSSAGPTMARSGPPWENRDESGIWNALYETVRQSLFSPQEFFDNLRVEGGLWNPLIYAVIFGVIGSIFGLITSMAMQSLPMMLAPGSDQVASFAFSGVFAFFALLLSPFFAAAGVFINAGIVHLFLYLFGGANKGFEATFRTVCYSTGTMLINIIPFCGGVISLFWNLVLVVIGLQKTHDTDTTRAAFAVATPLVLCCCLVVLFFSSIIALLGALGSSAN